jgi:hypothetical protein
MPAIVFLGVLVGVRRQPTLARPGYGFGIRALALAALTLFLCTFALSAVLPSLAGSKASSALVAASSSSPAELQRAQASAALATSLDPLSDAGQRAQATIAIHRGQWGQARGFLLDAINRSPADQQAWAQLEEVDLLTHNVPSALYDAQRLLALDPLAMRSAVLAQQANLGAAPPGESPTVAPTPAR